MMCVVCKHGKTKTGTMTATFEKEEATIVVKGVPAEVCENCGESYLSQEVTRRLLQLASDSAKAGVQVDIRRYVAA